MDTSLDYFITLQVGENGLSASGSDTPPSRSDPPPSCSDPRAMEQSPVSVPLVRTLRTQHNQQQCDNVSVHSSQLSSDGGDFQWQTNEPLMLSSQDGSCETKTKTAPQIESDLDSLIDSKNSGAPDFIPSAEVSDAASDGHISQPVFDTVDVHMNATDNILTKIKQELNVESWNEQCDSYEPGNTFGNYTSQQEPTWDFGGPHNFPTIAADSPQQPAQHHQAKISLPQLNTVGDTVTVSLGTATSTPILNWTWCGLCKQGTRNLKKHMKVCQMSPAMLSEAKFPCSKCSRLFRTRSYLIDHERSFHSSVPSYECCHCRRFFKYRMQLKRHKANCNGSVANDTLSPPCSHPAVTSSDLCLKL